MKSQLSVHCRWLGRSARPLLLVMLALLAGCTTLRQTLNPGFGRETVSAKVEERMGVGFGPAPCPPWQLILPNGACLEDGLDEEEAVLIALWNNAAFQELLLDLGVARGDLITAGLLPNPTFLYYFNVPFKPYRWLVDFPLESLWLRPIRIRGARREAERVQQRLTQAALDLIRDVRQSYADVLVAQGRYQVAEQAVEIRSQVARFAQASFDDDNISFQEVATAKINADQARQDAARMRYEVSVAEERLRNLLAIGAYREPLKLDGTPPSIRADLDAEALTAEAVATRPDFLATTRNVEAATQRFRLARIGWIQVLGIIDATTGNITDHEVGPGVRITLPFFNWNQGNIARARAELERAERNQQTIRNQIILDVHQAHFRYTQARAQFEILTTKVLPESERAIKRAEEGYREGATPYVVVLQQTDQVINARFSLAVLYGDLRRTWAELERSVGRHLETAPYALETAAPAPSVLPELPPAKESTP